ncbi:unnamed protein product [Colias eurytheme]|nr:unnamed protein product [Colias eurytheme]
MIKGQKGIGFLVKKSSNTKVQEFQPISDRVAILHVDIYDTSFSLIQVYAPTESCSETELKNFYNDLEIAMEKCSNKIILMGDMNAKIGQTYSYEHLVMGSFGYGKRNKRGQMFINFCLRYKLKIVNTLFKKPERLRWTWLAPNGRTKNEIDYIATNCPGIIENYNVLSKFIHPSDHRIIRITLDLGRRKKLTRARFNNTSSSKLNFNNFKNNILSVNFTNDNNSSVQDFYNTLINEIKKSLEPNTRMRERRIETVMTDEIINMKKELHSLRNTENKTKIEKKRISQLYKTIKRKIKSNDKEFRLKTLETFLEKTGGVKKAYKSLEIKKDLLSQLTHHSGSSVFNRAGLLDLATQYYRDLYKTKTIPTKFDSHTTYLNNDPIPIFLNEEVEQAIKNLKSDKSPGADGVTNEMIKAGSYMMVKTLTNLFNLILSQNRYSSKVANSTNKTAAYVKTLF